MALRRTLLFGFLLQCCLQFLVPIPQLARGADGSGKKVAEVGTVQRKIEFPPYDVGALYLAPNDSRGKGRDHYEGHAKGTVTIAIPANQELILVLNRKATENPAWLSKIAPDAIDGLAIIQLLAVDESESQICDKAMVYVDHLTALKRLIIDKSTTSDAGLSRLQHLTKLESISAMQTDVSGSSFKVLAGLKNLKHLIFDYCAVDSENLRYLAQLPNLTDLSLNSASITNSGVNNLKGCHSLKTLQLNGNPKIQADAIPCFAQMNGLVELGLDGTGIKSDSLQKLSGLKLKILKTPNHLSNDELKKLQKLLPQTHISVGGRKSLNESQEKMFAPLR